MDMFGSFSLVISLIFVLAIVSIVGQIVAIIDLFGRSDRDVVGDSRVLWALVIIFIPFAWVVYFVVGRRQRPVHPA